MSQRSDLFPAMLRITFIAGLLSSTAAAVAEQELRVCAEPDNLPFSNRQQEGFENKIAAQLADDLHAKLTFTWEKQRRGYIRHTLGAGRCDVIMGVPSGFERVLSTQPYYRSGYVFITARERHLAIKSFDDPKLRTLKIGLHAIGDDGSNSPPANALARRGIVKNIVGYPLWGEASVKNPQGLIVDAVAKGDIDLAIVWGPIGGFFAKPYAEKLVVKPVPVDPQMASMPFTFDIAVAVKKGNETLAKRLAKSIERKRREIHDILTAYNIPLIKPVLGSPPSLASRERALSKEPL